MPFPESKRVVYENNPLVEVTCQLRFPPILEIVSEQPAQFQKRIRDRYPLYQRSDAQIQLPGEVPAEISALVAKLPIAGLGQPTHRFTTANGETVIGLTSDSISISTPVYSRWEAFHGEVDLALSALQGIYTPAFYTRIGLRYQDLIDKVLLGLGDAPWSQLVKSPLLGVLGADEVRDEIDGIASEVVVKLKESGAEKVRIKHGLVVRQPPQEGDPAYLVDIDLFTDERSSANDVAAILGRFNRIAGDLFRWFITPDLESALRPVEIAAAS